MIVKYLGFIFAAFDVIIEYTWWHFASQKWMIVSFLSVNTTKKGRRRSQAPNTFIMQPYF